jgi:hypothetical protein
MVKQKRPNAIPDEVTNLHKGSKISLSQAPVNVPLRHLMSMVVKVSVDVSLLPTRNENGAGDRIRHGNDLLNPQDLDDGVT